jgi:ABC-type branched-subunit amino acid transport system substrate-binding protein
MHLSRGAALVAGATLLLTAGCDATTGDGIPEAGGALEVRLYGTDGTMRDPFADEFADPTVLAGMKGTAPLNPLSIDFVNRLLTVDDSLTDYTYAQETYDAVVISAIAAELAGTPDPVEVRRYINGVTTGGELCQTAAACLDLARDGEDLQYRGVSLRRSGFTDVGEPSTSSYATLHFGGAGRLDPNKTEFVGAGDESAASQEESPAPGPRPTEPEFLLEPLTFGGLLPLTGDLAGASPPMVAGALLAVEEINDAGGVFGIDVEWIGGDDGTNDAAVALATIESHIEEGAHVLIGAAGSGQTTAVLEEVVAAERILFSPSATAASLSELADDGYLFRTAPSDALQGAALADVLMRDGNSRIAIVARDDPYGVGLQGNVREALERFGMPADDLLLALYQPPVEAGTQIPDLAALVERIRAFGTEGVLIIGFEESAQLIQAMVNSGMVIRR